MLISFAHCVCVCVLIDLKSCQLSKDDYGLTSEVVGNRDVNRCNNAIEAGY